MTAGLASDAASSVESRLFGEAVFTRDQRRLILTPASGSLFAYLLLRRDTEVPRTRLMELLGDVSESTARRRLNTAVWRLRCALEADGTPRDTVLVSTRRGLTLAPGCSVWVDVSEFEACCQQGRPFEHWELEDAAALGRVVNLYRGPFLDGLYDDWVLAERARLADLYLVAVLRLAHWHRSRGEPETALHYAKIAIDSEPLREDLHRLVIRLYHQLGLPEMAQRQFDRCRDILKSELGVEPLPETRNAVTGASPHPQAATSVVSKTVRETLAELEHAREELRLITGRIDHSITALRAQMRAP